MRFVRVFSVVDPSLANVLDPDPYLRELPGLLGQLPPGARAFATDSDHYDFSSLRSVKDLKIDSLVIRETGSAQIGVEVSFAPNQFKHSAGLVIRYEGVVAIAVDVDPIGEGSRIWPDTRRLGDLQLDEILPADGGCTHEVKMTGGTLLVTCRDLVAKWGSE